MVIAASLLIGFILGALAFTMLSVALSYRGSRRMACELEKRLGIEPKPELTPEERIKRCAQISSQMLIQQTAEEVAAYTSKSTIMYVPPTDPNNLN